MLGPLVSLQSFVASVADRLQSPFLLLVRLYWGWQLTQTGWGKLHTLDKVTEFFSTLGIPAPGPTAAFIGTLEFTAGILLILGLFARLISIPMAINMIVAYITADREALMSFFSDPGKFYGADPFTFLFVSLLILIFGPGRFSVDALLTARSSAAKSPGQ